MKFTFTTTEWEILKHRLEADSAIAECLVDSLEGEEWDEIEIRETVAKLLESGNDSCDKKGIILNNMSILDMIILQDAADGSTFFAGMDDAIRLGNVTKGRTLAYHKVANALESKLHVDIPRA